MRDILLPIDVPDLIEGIDIGGESSMKAEDLVVDFCGHG